jgi:predicted Zn-ribbon and HTH transcriptional regulator
MGEVLTKAKVYCKECGWWMIVDEETKYHSPYCPECVEPKFVYVKRVDD